MRKKENIQRRIAIFLFFIFSISIAPKVFFHNALANHKDASACYHANNAHCLHQQGFNCHFDDLVVTVPYLQQPGCEFNFTADSFTEEPFTFYTSCTQLYLQHKANRGPPNS